MKRNLKYTIKKDTIYMNEDGLMTLRTQHVTFLKKEKGKEDIEHHARIVTYVDIKKKQSKLVSLLTNDMVMDELEIIDIYKKNGR